MFENIFITVGILALVIVLGIIAFFTRALKKVPQGKVLVRTGFGGIKVKFDYVFVFPVLHQLELMDISLKSIKIARKDLQGLICKDNMRADIEVVFYVRVNNNASDVERVAQSIGCARASEGSLLVTLFEAKFSEALKTVGKRFEFNELYNSREKFKQEILDIIGKDLNGYKLDDCAIDYLEQTSIEFLKADNILDSEGIRKITELTADQNILANQIRRDEEKTITKQNVESQEAILELNRQLSEKEESQKREIASVKAREEAEIDRVQYEERLKSESARISAEEELTIAEENKQRQVIVAQKSKMRTEAVETERVEKDRLLEVNERERVVELANIEKEKALEEERKNIQDVIRERVIVEKEVVIEEEKIKDTRAYAEAERDKAVAIKNAERSAEEGLVKQIKGAEAAKQAARLKADQDIMMAGAEKKAAEESAAAKIIMADALVAESAAIGLAEAQVIEAKAKSGEKQGDADAHVIRKKAEAEADGIRMRRTAEIEADEKAGAVTAQVRSQEGEAEANVQFKKGESEIKLTELRADADAKKGLADAGILEQKGLAEAKVIEAKAAALNKEGMAEAEVLEKKGSIEAEVLEKKKLAEAKGIEAKADAMKKLDGVGREHEEFKLKLHQKTELEMARIKVQTEVAQAMSVVMGEALKASSIQIVGGETMFFENIMNAMTRSKSVDAFVNNSEVIGELKNNLLGDGASGGDLVSNVRKMVSQFGLKTEDIKNLTLAALLLKMSGLTEDLGLKENLQGIMKTISAAGMSNAKVSDFMDK